MRLGMLVLGYPGPVWPTRVPTRVQRSAQLQRSPSSKHWLLVWPHTGEYCIGCSRKCGATRVLIACWWLSHTQHAKRGSPPTQFTVVPCMSWSGCKLAIMDTMHAFIYVRRVGFVKCREWRVACNRPTLACRRKIAAAIAFEVALQVASVACSVFMTSQLYRRLSALSVLSRHC